MALTTYLTVNGTIYSQKKNGVRTHFIHDALGSVVATVNNAGNVVNKYSYKPFGEILSKTGVGEDPKFLWVGGAGYRATNNRWAEKYVRARHYGEQQGMWTTVDPFWPTESAYVYVGGNPTNVKDISGMVALDWISGLLDKADETIVKKRFGKSPSCIDVLACLRGSRGTRPPGGAEGCKGTRFKGGIGYSYSPEFALCVFWQESNLGRAALPGDEQKGIGNVEGGNGAFGALIGKECSCGWMKKFKNYTDFLARATDCEKARAAYDYMRCRGIAGYGPQGATKYGSSKKGKFEQCEECLRSSVLPSEIPKLPTPTCLGDFILNVERMIVKGFENHCFGCFKEYVHR